MTALHALDFSGSRPALLPANISAVKPKHILFLTRDWDLDGAERQLCYLTCNLDPRRYVPVVITDHDGPLTAYLRACGVQVHALPFRGWRRLGYLTLRYVDALRATRLAKKCGCDLVHTSDLWKSGYAHFMARRLGVPSVVHVRGPFLPRDVIKHDLPNAHGVIAIAQRYEDALLKAGIGPQHLARVDDAVDLQRFSPDICGTDFRQSWGIKGRLAVGMVGRLDPFKKVLEFLAMTAAAEGMHPGAALYFLIGAPGPKSYMQKVHQAIKHLGLAQCVVLTGRLDTMPQTFAGLDVLATWSGGSVMYEAMACGKPVLSIRPDDGHFVHAHTLHNQTAWCVNTVQPKVAAAELVTLLQNAALRERLGQAARRHVQQHLSPARLALQTQAFYDRLLAIH